MNEPEIAVTPVENNDTAATPKTVAEIDTKEYYVPNRHDRRRAKAKARKANKQKSK